MVCVTAMAQRSDAVDADDADDDADDDAVDDAGDDADGDAGDDADCSQPSGVQI